MPFNYWVPNRIGLIQDIEQEEKKLQELQQPPWWAKAPWSFTPLGPIMGSIQWAQQAGQQAEEYYFKPMAQEALFPTLKPPEYEQYVEERKGEMAGALGVEPEMIERLKIGGLAQGIPWYAGMTPGKGEPTPALPGGGLREIYEKPETFPKYVRGATELGMALPYYMLGWRAFGATGAGKVADAALNRAFRWLFKVPIAKYTKMKTGFTPQQIESMQQVFKSYEAGMEAGAWQNIFQSNTVRYDVLKRVAQLYPKNPEAALAQFNAFAKTDPEFVRAIQGHIQRQSALKLPGATQAVTSFSRYAETMPVAGGLPRATPSAQLPSPPKPLELPVAGKLPQRFKGYGILRPESLRAVWGDTKGMATELTDHLFAVKNVKQKPYPMELAGRAGVMQVPKPPKMPFGTSIRERGLVTKAKEAMGSFFNRWIRTRNLLLRADGWVEGGKMQQTFQQPINRAVDAELAGKAELFEAWDKFAKVNKSAINQALGDKVIEIDGFPFGIQERIAAYLSPRDPYYHQLLIEKNGIPEATLDKAAASLTDTQKAIADFWHKYTQGEGPKVAPIYEQIEGKPFKVVEGRIPIRISSQYLKEEGFPNPWLNEARLRYARAWPSSQIRKGMLRPRTKGTRWPVRMDYLNLAMEDVAAVEHYMAFEPVMRDLQKLLKHPRLHNAIVKTQGQSTFDVLARWLTQSADPDPLRVSSWAEGMFRLMRTNAVIGALGLNITASMKQPVSFIIGAGYIGEVQAIKGVFTYMRHPQETNQLIKRLAPRVWARSQTFEREVAELTNRQLGIRGLKVPLRSQVRRGALFFLRKADRTTVFSLWRGAYDDAIQRGLGEIEAARYATDAIVKGQPFFSVQEIPELMRSGELAKALTMFTNQLNQNFNAIYEIIGKVGGKQLSKPEAIKRLIEIIVVSTLIIGAISRSRPAKNAKELLTDIAGNNLASLPLFGRFIASGIQGMFGGLGADIITTQVLNSLQQLGFQINREQWDKVAQEVPELMGYLVGLPVAQPKRTFQALVNLAQGKSDDWAELIWGEYRRQQAREGEEKPKRKPIKPGSPFKNPFR